MHSQPGAGSCYHVTWTQAMMLKCGACQAHWDVSFFTPHIGGKEVVCKLAGYLGLGRRVGGWEGRAVTLEVSGRFFNHIKPHVGVYYF